MSIISGIEGIIESKSADSVLIRVGNGFILQANVPTTNINALPNIGENIKLRRYLKIDKTNHVYGYSHNNKIVSTVELKKSENLGGLEVNISIPLSRSYQVT